MNYKDILKYAFAAGLAGMGAVGFMNGVQYWYIWLGASLGYLTLSALFDSL